MSITQNLQVECAAKLDHPRYPAIAEVLHSNYFDLKSQVVVVNHIVLLTLIINFHDVLLSFGLVVVKSVIVMFDERDTSVGNKGT